MVFEKGEQSRFMQLVRAKTNMNWVQLARYLNVVKGTICHILKERTTFREEFFLKLCKLANLNQNDFKISNKINIFYNCDVTIPTKINRS